MTAGKPHSCSTVVLICFTCPAITVATVILRALDRVRGRLLGLLGSGSPKSQPHQALFFFFLGHRSTEFAALCSRANFGWLCNRLFVPDGAGGRDGNSADISEKTLHDVYLRPWKAFIQNGGRGMMLAHNELNGIQM